MTNPDQLRAVFEAWARRGGWHLQMWPSGPAEYMSTATEAAWQGFAAGHAAALAGAQPVANLYRDHNGKLKLVQTAPPPFSAFPVYASPLPQVAPALSDEQIETLRTRGEVVVSWDEAGRIVAVTRQDDEGRILSVIAQAGRPPAQGNHSPDAGKMVADGVPAAHCTAVRCTCKPAQMLTCPRMTDGVVTGDGGKNNG